VERKEGIAEGEKKVRVACLPFNITLSSHVNQLKKKKKKNPKVYDIVLLDKRKDDGFTSIGDQFVEASSLLEDIVESAHRA
jgi:hypothetical protein